MKQFFCCCNYNLILFRVGLFGDDLERAVGLTEQIIQVDLTNSGHFYLRFIAEDGCHVSGQLSIHSLDKIEKLLDLIVHNWLEQAVIVGDDLQANDHILFVLLFDEAIDKQQDFPDKNAPLLRVQIVAVEDGRCSLYDLQSFLPQLLDCRLGYELRLGFVQDSHELVEGIVNQLRVSW